MAALNNIQLEILKLFKTERSEKELFEIKQLLSEYVAKKLIEEVDLEAEEKGYTPETVDSWKNEHFRSHLNESSN